MAYIDTKYLFQCETCRHHISGKCDTWCDHGEEYIPLMTKIPTADVVEVVRCGQCKWYLKGSMSCGHPFGLSSDRVMTTQFCSKGELKL